ncbi:MAG: prephenate dehydratase [Ferruginibacter sp.]
MNKRIAIQGFAGSFHEMAAMHYLGKNIVIIPCSSFSELVKTAENKKLSDGGFMAIENSIAGSILPNYALLEKSNLLIAGEIYLHISHNLMVNKGVKLEDIKEVHSHPMALLQCMDFLDKFPHWKLVEKEDTASSAKYIQQHNNKHAAAIAGKPAAALYQLEMIKPNIQTHKNNYTRFLFLQKSDNKNAGHDANKASISFQTDHSKGALARVLTKIASYNINLSKLQSIPVPAKEWQYIFHADLEFDTVLDFEKAIEKIKPVIAQLKIFGIYKKGETIF